MLIADPMKRAITDKRFYDLFEQLNDNDCIVLNNTRVLPARLYGHKESGGKVELLAERVMSETRLLAQLRSSKSPRSGTRLIFEQFIHCRVVGRDKQFFILELDQRSAQSSWFDALEAHGHVPLPPYIQREDELADRERYQTVFNKTPGAVAAPTAGLHFSEEMLQRIQHKGVQRAEVTLHVGSGTFQPVRDDDLQHHQMHCEYIDVPQSTCDVIAETRKKGGRVVAIGTTVVRSLETAAATGELKPYQGDTQLFIKPGYAFQVVDALLTNFHLPKSTLIMLVSALAGREFILSAYRHAVEKRYRFFSYGDAMWIPHRVALERE